MANYNTQTTGSAGVKPTVKEFYDKHLLAIAKPDLVFNQFGQARDIPKGNGTTVEFRKMVKLPLATTALTEGVTPDGQEISMTSLKATVKQYGAYITTSDVLELTAFDNIVMENNEVLGLNGAETLEYITAQILAAGTNVLYAGRGESRAALTEASNKLCPVDVKRAAAILKKNVAQKLNGDYVGIVHPFVAFDLMSDPEWIDVKKYDNKGYYAGEIGKIGGVRFVESTMAPVFTGAGADGEDVYTTFIFGKDAYGRTKVTGGGMQMIAKPKGSGGSSDPLDQRATQGWKAMHTAVILNQLDLVRIESVTSAI